MSHFTNVKVKLETGDIVVFYTDGITEMENQAGEAFGSGRLGEAVATHRAEDPEILVAKVLLALEDFAGKMQAEDDLTIVVMKLVRVTMEAMVLKAPHTPLERLSVADPRPGPGQLLVKVDACGVCRTDLHVVDGELPHAHSPIIPGHEIVGTVVGRAPASMPSRRAIASAFHGSRRPAAPAPIAAPAARISATTPASPATRWTVAMRTSSSPTTGSASPCRPGSRLRSSRPGSARD